MEAAGLPDLDEARSRPRHELKAIPPVPSTRRRCPPRNPRCNDGTDATPRPTPAPAATPQPPGRGGGPFSINSAAFESSPWPGFVSGVAGSWAGLSRFNFYGSAGGYSVSDSPARLLPPADVAAAPAPEPAPIYQTPQGRVNVASSANGGWARASSTFDQPPSWVYSPGGAIDGDRRGSSLGGGRWAGWTDAGPAYSYQNNAVWLEVNFSGHKRIEEIDLFTQQDNYASPAEPTESMTFSSYGLTGFDVQYWTASGWMAVPGGAVTGNNKVWRKLTFPAVTTDKIRVLAHASPDGYVRLAEVEAWGVSARYNVALASNGGVASASSSLNVPGWLFTPAGANDGDRRGANWGAGGGWNDAGPAYSYQSNEVWLEVAFASPRIIDEVDVFTAQDAYASPAEPTESMTFTQYGLTGFEVQYLVGSAWMTVPGGTITGNNMVWRKVTFPALTAGKIRVRALASPDGYGRLAEVEAYEAAAAPGTGLTGAYYNGTDFDAYRLTRPDAAVDFNWGSGSPHAQVNADNFSARWTGTVVPRFSEDYTFYTTADDGVRLWIDGRLVIDRWQDQGPTEWSGAISLEANRQYAVRMEFYERWGGAMARLSWSSASQAKEVIPQSRLYGGSGTDVGGPGYNFAAARVDPINRTGASGVDPYSRNYNFQIPLVSLVGRAGLDLGLTLSYNSLVWTRDATGVTFDADQGFPSPGFRLGFPTIEPKFVNPQLQVSGQPARYSYLLITPSGGRVELRQAATLNLYESADSSYLQLIDTGALTLLSPDGTQLRLSLRGGLYRCDEVRDRNGNYLTVSYYDDGRIRAVTDTLGRVVTFNYDNFLNLTSITQPWTREGAPGQPTPTPDEVHQWATFGYTDVTLQPSFSNLAVIGEQPGTAIPALAQVGLPDGSFYRFSYNQWGQVWKVTRYAADSVGANGQPNESHPLTSTRIDLPGSDLLVATPQSDCPRFTQERTWVEYGVMGQSGEVTTRYDAWSPDMVSCEVTLPDGTTKQVSTYGTPAEGWMKGLAKHKVTKDNGQTVRTTILVWEHDGGGADAYPTNPRVKETTITDPQGNGRTTRVTYTTPTDFQGESGYTGLLNISLPKKVEECSAGCSSVLRTAVTDYKVPGLGEYAARRILGLVRYQYLYEGAEAPANLRSKVGYVYDDTGYVGGDTSQPKFLQTLLSPAWQHYKDDYGASLQWRGNITRVRRYEVNQQNGQETGAYTESLAGYNIAGVAVFTQDAAGHRTTVSYEDAFYANVNRTNTDPALKLKTFAYPTAVTDPDGFTAWTWYNYDMGVAAKARSQKPNTTANGPDGPVTATFHDAAGRVIRTANSINGAHTEWVYDPSMTLVKTFTTVSDESMQNPALRLYSAAALDGLGRVRGTARDFPGSTTATPAGNYSAQITSYDAMGRAVFQSNPTEMRIASGTWTPAGDDANGGLWRGTTQEYDWKGRIRREVNVDNADRLIEYSGCGCAGGEVVTIRDELVPTLEPPPAPAQARRTQRVFYDELGRAKKSETLKWDGSVYSTTTTKYDGLDRPVRVRQYPGVAPQPEPQAEGLGYQTTTLIYDGYGRLKERHVPEQDAGRSTVYNYNNDDTVASVTEARGVKAVYGYGNRRHLVTSISYDLSGVQPGQDVAAAAAVTFSYDAAGNRTAMTDGLGQASYSYDALSRLTSETRQLPVGTYSLAYSYNLAGELTGITDNSFGTSVTYAYNSAGQLKEVIGGGLGLPSPQLAHSIQYRAWGGLKAASYADGRTLAVGYDAQLRLISFQVPGLLDKTYDYYADGRLRYAGDLSDGRYDRLNRYDHAGRLTQALTGSEARGGSAVDGPYDQTYGYDAFDHTTSRSSRHWSVAYSDSRQYTNGRNDAWTYDAEGNSTGDTKWTYRYDAAGRMGDIIDPTWSNQADTTHAYDGDGQMLKASTRAQSYFSLEDTYYLRSTVLGGQVVAEIGPGGQKLRGFAYDPAGGVLTVQKLATPSDVSAYVAVEHSDASGASVRMGGALGADFAKLDAELDPVGAGMSLEDPYASAPLYELPDETRPSYPARGNPTNVRGKGCTRYGIPWDCSDMMRDIGYTAGGVGNKVSRMEQVTWTRKVYAVWGSDGGSQDGVEVTNMNQMLIYSSTKRYLDNVESFEGYMGGGALQQQAQQPSYPQAESRARQLLARQDCANFITELIYIANTLAIERSASRLKSNFEPLLGLNGDSAPSYDQYYGLHVYDKAVREGRVTASGVSGQNRQGNIVTTTYGATTENSFIQWNNEFYKLGSDDAALQIIHESLHLVPYLSDFALAGAAHIIETRSATSPGNRGSFARQDIASDYLNRQIEGHCRP